MNNDQSGPNGVQTVQAVNTGSQQLEIWAGDGPQLNQGCPSFLAGKCSTVKVIEAQSGALTHVIPTGGAARADELCNDTKDNLVLIANDAEADFSFGTPFISFISTKTYKIVAQLQIPQTTGGIEQCQWDHDTGLFFLNIPQVNGAEGQVLVIPPPTGNPVKVLGSYVIPLAQCALPQGMAIGGPEGPPTKNELFGPWLVLGCNGVATGGFRNSVIIDKRTGANVAIAWGLGGADQVWANDTNFFVTGSSCTAATCLSGTSSQLGVVNFNPGNAQVISLTNLGLVLGGVSSHSVAADCNLGSDESSGQLFVPVAGGVQIFTSARPTGVPTRLSSRYQPIGDVAARNSRDVCFVPGLKPGPVRSDARRVRVRSRMAS